jgi:hypothetical protein
MSLNNFKTNNSVLPRHITQVLPKNIDVNNEVIVNNNDDCISKDLNTATLNLMLENARKFPIIRTDFYEKMKCEIFKDYISHHSFIEYIKKNKGEMLKLESVTMVLLARQIYGNIICGSKLNTDKLMNNLISVQSYAFDLQTVNFQVTDFVSPLDVDFNAAQDPRKKHSLLKKAQLDINAGIAKSRRNAIKTLLPKHEIDALLDVVENKRKLALSKKLSCNVEDLPRVLAKKAEKSVIEKMIFQFNTEYKVKPEDILDYFDKLDIYDLTVSEVDVLRTHYSSFKREELSPIDVFKR